MDPCTPCRGRRSSAPLAALVLLALAACSGCKAFGKKDAHAKLTDAQLRSALHQWADHVSASVQGAADEIAATGEDKALRKTTLHWKLRVIPAVRTVVSAEDVRAALIDAWALAVQMRIFLESGDGSKLFGDGQHLAIAAAQDIEQDAERIAAKMLDKDALAAAREGVLKYCEAHPVRGMFAREAVLPSKEPDNRLAPLTSILNAPLSILKPLDETARAVDEFTRVAANFSEMLADMPAVLRWQAELLAYTVEETATVESVTKSVAEVAESARTLSTTAEGLPASVKDTVKGTLAELEAHQASLMTVLDGIDKTLADAQALAESATRTGEAWKETALAFGLGPKPDSEKEGEEPAKPPDAAAEEKPAFQLADVERSADSLTRTATEIRALVADVRALAGSPELKGSLAAADEATRSTIDHAAWRAVQVGLVLIAACGALWFAASRLARRRAAAA